MSGTLHELEVLVLDCQTSGATPAHGDLLELGWAVCGPGGLVDGIRERWVVPRTERRISGPVRALTGWSEACLGEALSERALWDALCAQFGPLAARAGTPLTPSVIHFARFELAFLRDLHERLSGAASDFPLDVLCVHSVAARLFPELPRRNIRALSGFLGHSPGLVRRAGGHVEATAFIWRALLPRLAELGIERWDELKRWLAEPVTSPRRTRRTYPLAMERRRALPDRPGVYRFLRPNGDVIYVGKATSLHKRVAGHFRGGGKPNERGLELLTQVHDIAFTETPSVLEAALLETDEIKALDPPYNLQLKLEERSAWFVDRAHSSAAPAADAVHVIGPLPSRRALSAAHAFVALASGADATPGLCALVLAVPRSELPEQGLFRQGFAEFEQALLHSVQGRPERRVEQAARSLWLARRRKEAEPSAEAEASATWDLARVRRRLERNLIQAFLLQRRARFLCLLSECDLAFREPGMQTVRALSIAGGEIRSRHDLPALSVLSELAPRPLGPRRARQACFDAARYDRLRVLATELARVQNEGGELALRLGHRVYSGEPLARLLRLV